MSRLACASAALLLAAVAVAADKTVDVGKKEALTEGPLTVAVVRAERDFNWLSVRLEFRLARDGKRVITEESWAGRLNHAGLADDKGKSYTLISGFFTDDDDERTKPPTIFPGRTVKATVNFKLPPRDVESLTFELPGPDDESTVRFLIPGRLVK